MFLQHFHYNPAQWGTQVRSDPHLDQNTEGRSGRATAFRHRSRLGLIPYSSKCPMRPRYILLEKRKQFSITRWLAVKKPTTKIRNASKTFSNTCKYAIWPKALVIYGLSFLWVWCHVVRFYFQGNLVISKNVPFTHTGNVLSGLRAKPPLVQL